MDMVPTNQSQSGSADNMNGFVSEASADPRSGTDAKSDEVLRERAVMVDVLKGGCGKSALSFNIADALARRGNEVLYMDLDPNGHITSVLGFEEVFKDDRHDYGYVTLNDGQYGNVNLSPDHMIYDTDYRFDFVPSYDDMEFFNGRLKESYKAETVLARHFLLPIEEEYDYFIMDGGGERSKIADNGFYAGRSTIVPLIPGQESISAWKRTYQRVITPLKQLGLNVMAIVPNLLSQPTDRDNKDRRLLKNMTQTEYMRERLPSFARVDWDKVDNSPKSVLPGIRERQAIRDGVSNGRPVYHEDRTCDQIDHFDKLAQIIEQGGVHR